MHELSITQGIIEICLQHAASRHITSVEVEIGVLSGVDPEAVAFCFEASTRETPMHGARLRISEVPATGSCQECGHDFRLLSLYDACPQCSSYRVTVMTGDEMRVREIEVAD